MLYQADRAEADASKADCACTTQLPVNCQYKTVLFDFNWIKFIYM